MLLGGAVKGNGNALTNTIYGNSADNLLDGGTGADSMYGGAGNDAYVLDNISDLVIENLNEGSDMVYASSTTGCRRMWSTWSCRATPSKATATLWRT